MTLLSVVSDEGLERLKLQVLELEVRAPDHRLLLHIDSLHIESGERVCITGPSGAGKSTFLFALAGLTEHTVGSVRWNDLELQHASRARRAAFRHQHVGLVFQDYLLFEELNALDNAALADAWAPRDQRRMDSGKPSRRQHAITLLTKLGIDPGDRRSVMSHSGGERQRIAVARALASSPEIILADEPTASLDRESADALIDDLLSLAHEQSQTLIVVSHDSHLRDACDRVITLSDGRVISDSGQIATEHAPSESTAA